MKIILWLLLSAIFVSATCVHASIQQDPPPQEPAPAPQQPAPPPATEPQVTGRPFDIPQPDIFEQQRQQQQMQQMLDAFGIDSGDSRRNSRQILQPHFAPVMKHDAEFDLRSIPLQDWLHGKDAAGLPWKIEIKDPTLRMDQRLELPYTAKIPAGSLNKSGPAHDLFFIMGISNTDGGWFVRPKIVHQSVKTALPSGVELWFSDWVFAQPGTYVLWFVLYDAETSKHNVARRRVQVSKLQHDPFPNATDHLPAVELPYLSDREGGTIVGFYGGLSLPVQNRRKLAVELMPILSPPEQWAGEITVVRDHNEETAAVVNTLSQLQLADGVISLTGLDVARHAVPFEQKDLSHIDWRGFLDALHGADTKTVSAKMLAESKTTGAYFRNTLSQHLVEPGEALRVVIVVSSPMVFQRGSDLQLQSACHCRVYHLRFRHNAKDVFDDIEKLLKPLHPKTFNLITPNDMRKALAEIIRDLEEPGN